MPAKKGNKKQKDSNFLFIKLSSHKIPEFREIREKDYIYFGHRNDYPNYLMRLFNRSAKHNAIINQKSSYIFGTGFGEAGRTLVNEEGETLDDITKKIVIDLELFGGFALEVIWNKAGSQIAECRHVDFSNLRSDEDNEEFYFTKNWVKATYDEHGNERTWPNSQPEQEDDWEVIPEFNPGKKSGRQIYYFKQYRPGLLTYPLPEYLGATGYIELDYQIANYWYNAVKFGFTASHIITFYGDGPTKGEREKIEKQITDKFTGTDNAGRFIINFSNNKDKGGSEVLNITPQDLDKQFNILNATVQQEIFSGHRITSPMLFGIKTEGQLGGRTELLESNELFQNNYVTPKQKLVTSAMNEVMRFKGLQEDLKLNKIEPIGFMFSEAIIKEVLPPQAVKEMVASKFGIDLSKFPEPSAAPALPPEPQTPEFMDESKEKKLFDLFKKHKKERKGTFVAKRDLKFEDTKDLKKSEEKFVEGLRDKQLSVLDLLDKDPLMPAEELGKAIKIPVGQVNDIISSLKDKKLIKTKSVKSGDTKVESRTPVSDAKKILKESPAPTEEIFVVYSYEWQQGFSDADIGESREFCRNLLTESKSRESTGTLWSREDIELIQNDFGKSVWETRGGWYTKPGTNIHLPQCRHIWTQQIIRV